MNLTEQQHALQRVFNRIVNHLAQQKSKAVDPSDGKTCLYRAPGGKMCAVGCLISDDLYWERLEGATVRTDSLRKVVIDSLDDWTSPPADEDGYPIWQPEHTRLFNFLAAAQYIHDDLPVSQWRTHFEILARSHGLAHGECLFLPKLED